MKMTLNLFNIRTLLKTPLFILSQRSVNSLHAPCRDAVVQNGGLDNETSDDSEMDQLLLDAKRLASRLREHNASSDALIGQANNLHFKVDAMKQYHDVVRDLNEVANRRPRSTLILGSQEENARIRELQQENIELQTSVAEYQSALELIMAKYREQVFGLIKANRLDASCMKLNNYKELQAKTEQICEMAAVMAQAIYIDDEAIQQEQEKMASIESENKGLRELLKISGIPFPATATSEEEASPKNDPNSACTSTPKE